MLEVCNTGDRLTGGFTGELTGNLAGGLPATCDPIRGDSPWVQGKPVEEKHRIFGMASCLDRIHLAWQQYSEFRPYIFLVCDELYTVFPPRFSMTGALHTVSPLGNSNVLNADGLLVGVRFGFPPLPSSEISDVSLDTIEEN
ncbi:hypothetical protein PG988_006499 [Apiospora saccharicola]